MIRSNNPYIGQNTRRLLVNQRFGISDQTRKLINKVLDHLRETNPSGLVYDVAIASGAIDKRACDASSIAEIWYAACSLTDDLQDGDCDYLDCDFSLKINTQAELICLFFGLLNEFDNSLIRCFSRSGCRMLSGQYLEITRDNNWSIEEYKNVAMEIAGVPFSEYMRLAATAAEINPEPYMQLGMSFGLLLQVFIDIEQDDPRLKCLPIKDVKTFVDREMKVSDALFGILGDDVSPIKELIGGFDYAKLHEMGRMEES